MLCIDAIVDPTYVYHLVKISEHTISTLLLLLTAQIIGSTTASLRTWLHCTGKHYIQQIFIEDQERPPLDMVTVDQERELHSNR